MNLEPITQSEVSEKEKIKYCILMHIHGIQKDNTDEPICKAVVEMQTQRTDLSTQGQGEERENGKDGESNMETYTLPYVKYITNGNLLYMTQGTQTRAL